MSFYHAQDEMSLEMLAADDRADALRNADAEFEAEYRQFCEATETPVTDAELVAMAHSARRYEGIVSSLRLQPPVVLTLLLEMARDGDPQGTLVSVIGLDAADLPAFAAAVTVELAWRETVVSAA